MIIALKILGIFFVVFVVLPIVFWWWGYFAVQGIVAGVEHSLNKSKNVNHNGKS